MVGFTSAQLDTHLANIFATLANTGAVDSMAVAARSLTAISVIRAKALSTKQLEDVGWGRLYRLSVYAVAATVVLVEEKDDVVLDTEGALRVWDIGKSPAGTYTRFDLGDRWSGRL